MIQRDLIKIRRQAEIGETTNEFATLGVALALDKRRHYIEIHASVLAWLFVHKFVNCPVLL